MSNNNTLPAEVVEQIKQEAQIYMAFVPDNKASYIAGATEYATKMHQVQQENEKLKAMATGWRPLLEEVLVMDAMWGDLPGEFINKVKTFLYGE